MTNCASAVRLATPHLTWEGLGLDFQIAANIGNDQFGEWLRQGFGAHAARWPVSPMGTTLSVGITHPNGERTFFTTRGHIGALSWPEVVAMLDTERLKGGIVLLCGSFLTDALVAQYDALFDWAAANDIQVALDTGWPIDGWTDANRAKARKWLSRCHLALFNEVETTRLANSVEPAEAAHKLKALMPKDAIVVVKRGPDGALAVGSDDQLVSVPAPRRDSCRYNRRRRCVQCRFSRCPGGRPDARTQPGGRRARRFDGHIHRSPPL